MHNLVFTIGLIIWGLIVWPLTTGDATGGAVMVTGGVLGGIFVVSRWGK